MQCPPAWLVQISVLIIIISIIALCGCCIFTVKLGWCIFTEMIFTVIMQQIKHSLSKTDNYVLFFPFKIPIKINSRKNTHFFPRKHKNNLSITIQHISYRGVTQLRKLLYILDIVGGGWFDMSGARPERVSLLLCRHTVSLPSPLGGAITAVYSRLGWLHGWCYTAHGAWQEDRST